MKSISRTHAEAVRNAKTEQEKVKAAANAMIEKPMDMIRAILLKHEQGVIEVMCELHKEKEAAAKAERDRIVNLLMIQHEMANGAHNYWHVAAQLIQADVASDT